MHDHPTIVSSVDYARLQGLMCTLIGSTSPLAALLRRKLDSVRIMLPARAGSDLVTSGRCVQFSIDGNRVEDRTLVWDRQSRTDDAHLSLWTPRGLALLGLSTGQCISYRTDSGSVETLEVDYVFPGDEETSPLARQTVGAASAADRSAIAQGRLGPAGLS